MYGKKSNVEALLGAGADASVVGILGKPAQKSFFLGCASTPVLFPSYSSCKSTKIVWGLDNRYTGDQLKSLVVELSAMVATKSQCSHNHQVLIKHQVIHPVSPPTSQTSGALKNLTSRE
ncbi:hypothetical protein BSKO_03235 [Bryopsis sp. KO-2023]|nr:hypothetical protein BSKO_03235 [Bryopsis sp. KO-2023]